MKIDFKRDGWDQISQRSARLPPCRLHPVLPPRSIQGFTSLRDSGHLSINSTLATSSWVSCFIQFLSIHLPPSLCFRTGQQQTDFTGWPVLFIFYYVHLFRR